MSAPTVSAASPFAQTTATGSAVDGWRLRRAFMAGHEHGVRWTLPGTPSWDGNRIQWPAGFTADATVLARVQAAYIAPKKVASDPVAEAKHKASSTQRDAEWETWAMTVPNLSNEGLDKLSGARTPESYAKHATAIGISTDFTPPAKPVVEVGATSKTATATAAAPTAKLAPAALTADGLLAMLEGGAFTLDEYKTYRKVLAAIEAAK